MFLLEGEIHSIMGNNKFKKHPVRKSKRKIVKTAYFYSSYICIMPVILNCTKNI